MPMYNFATSKMHIPQYQSDGSMYSLQSHLIYLLGPDVMVITHTQMLKTEVSKFA